MNRLEPKQHQQLLTEIFGIGNKTDNNPVSVNSPQENKYMKDATEILQNKISVHISTKTKTLSDFTKWLTRVLYDISFNENNKKDKFPIKVANMTFDLFKYFDSLERFDTEYSMATGSGDEIKSKLESIKKELSRYPYHGKTGSNLIMADYKDGIIKLIKDGNFIDRKYDAQQLAEFLKRI